jgi:hypothetical protein
MSTETASVLPQGGDEPFTPIIWPKEVQDALSAPANPLNSQVGGSHYKDYEISPALFLQKNRVPFCEANAIKYILRHRLKGGRLDLEKAIHYITIVIEMEYSI